MSGTPINDVFDAGFGSGRQVGWEEGFAAGLEVGLDVGAARMLLHGLVPELTPHGISYRERLAAEPACAARCGRCSACVRQTALARQGGDFPGADW